MTDEYFNEMISDLRETVRSIEKDLKTIEKIGDVMLRERYTNVPDGPLPVKKIAPDAPLPVKKKNKDVYKTEVERNLECAKFCDAQVYKGGCNKCAANQNGVSCMEVWLDLEADPEVSQDG